MTRKDRRERRQQETDFRIKYNLLRSLEIVTDTDIIEDNEDEEELRIILYQKVCLKLQHKREEERMNKQIKDKNSQQMTIDELVTLDMMSLFN